MKAEELMNRLAELDPEDDVPTWLAMSAIGCEESYLIAALETLEEVSGIFGRILDPEIDYLLHRLRSLT